MEDQNSLQKKVNFSAPLSVLTILFIAFIILAGAFGIFILASTPMKTILPGYLKKSERSATEEQHLRLDSLVRVYEINEAYISGILNALNPQDTTGNSNMEKRHTSLMTDSLLPPSEVEKKFMENIRERDKYNINYAAPAAAQTMLFSPVNKAAVQSEGSKHKYVAEFILPLSAPVSAVAEGKVISVASSPRSSGGYEIIIQHPKGFLSKTSRLSNIMVSPGDKVTSGQIIAGGPIKNGMKSNYINFQIWHDGDPILPDIYINGSTQAHEKNL